MNEDRSEVAGSTMSDRLETYLGEVITERTPQRREVGEPRSAMDSPLGGIEDSLHSSAAGPPEPYTVALIVNEDRFEAAATTVGGRVESGPGDTIGDGNLESDGLINKANSSAKDMLAGANDALRAGIDQAPARVRDGAQRAAAVARANPLAAFAVVGAVGLILGTIFGARARSGAPRSGSSRTQAEIAQEALALKKGGEPARFSAS